ncbi:hypothetical protein DPMN_173864 [Dreissena polymorpha]|uniref:CCHC-type domain-containing protein n=1 Tax=Dreissena polymorpha TaxID=45954 RepID=A0A9D4E2D8_DREPO|nr:hypothetical protein DPMN_173864 [Dreissena polymorpha]
MADEQDSDSEVNFNVNHLDRGDDDDEVMEEDHHYTQRHVTRRRQASHVKSDSFTGEEDWDQYISNFEDCAELAQWSEKEKLLYIATSLKQQARAHYCSLPSHERRSYNVLTIQLEQRFGSKRQSTRWLSKIQNRTRGKTKTVAAFGDEIRLYAQKAYVSLGPEAQEMIALEHFLKSFSPEMRCRLMDKGCRTIREAVEVVERYEDILGRSTTGAGGSLIRGVIENRKGSGDTGESQDVRSLGDIQCSIKRIEQRLDALEASSPRSSNSSSSRSCFTCGARDHFYRSCPRNNNIRGKLHKKSENFRPSPQ